MTMRVLSATPLLQIIGAYTANDCVGALLTFTLSGSSLPNKGARIRRLTLIDADKEAAEFWLYLFNASPAAAARTDADAFAPVAADYAKLIGSIHIAAAEYVAGPSDSVVLQEKDFPVVVADAALYGVLVCVGTPTYTAADDLLLKLLIED
jgi:hypothetical protein